MLLLLIASIDIAPTNYSPGFLLAAPLSRRCGGGNYGQLWAKYGVVCYQQRRIEAYLACAYIFKALGAHSQSPRRNFGAGPMRNAPWAVALAKFPHQHDSVTCSLRPYVDDIFRQAKHSRIKNKGTTHML